MTILDDVKAAYAGSDGEATRALYARLDECGLLGQVAINLFRACKTSERAKRYRKGRGHISASYSRKDWSIGNLARLLDGSPHGLTWGWAVDQGAKAKGDPHVNVIYVDLPTGQVSWHVGQRALAGPDYAGEWDRAFGSGPARVCAFVATVLGDPLDPEEVKRSTAPAPGSGSPPGRQEALL